MRPVDNDTLTADKPYGKGTDMADEKKPVELTDEQADKASGGDGIILDPTGIGGSGTSGSTTFTCWHCRQEREGTRYDFGTFGGVCEWCKIEIEARYNIKLEPIPYSIGGGIIH